MRVFGESLNLCKCIGNDFTCRLDLMNRRLKNLEARQNLRLSIASNYSVIIKNNIDKSNRVYIPNIKKMQMCGTEQEMREVAGRICKNYLHGAWKTVETKDIQFSRVSGGLSNFLYYVALPEDKMDSQALVRRNSEGEEPRKVLLRIYGQVHGERAVDAIVTESVIFTLLSERKLGPRLWGVFSGGRIEEYIPSRPLTNHELSEPAYSMKIAEKMAIIHTMDIPLSKEPHWLWKSMTKWLKAAKTDQLADSAKGKNENEQAIIERLRAIDFEKEIEWLKKYLATVDSPVVFCHNDMQEGNILLPDDTDLQPAHDYDVDTHTAISPKTSKENTHTLEYIDQEFSIVPAPNYINPHFEENTNDTILSSVSDSGEPKLYIIDFEYCSYNYRGFDIANHFQEWIYDYTKKEHPFYEENLDNQPTLEQKEIFIKEYLKHYHANASDGKCAEPTIDAVNKLLNEVEAFALASHLFWSLWSVVNASKSQIPFGYWEYAISRLDVYFQLKQEVIKNERSCVKRKIEEVDI